jgi:hypothetical protein
MGRLYSLVGADSHTDPDYGRFEPDEAGAFDFPDEVSDTLGRFAVKGKALWETEEARAERLHGIDMARRRDPATMLSMQEQNVALMRQLTELTAQLAASQIAKAPAPAHPAPADGARMARPARLPAVPRATGSPRPRRGPRPRGAPARRRPARRPSLPPFLLPAPRERRPRGFFMPAPEAGSRPSTSPSSAARPCHPTGGIS